MLREQRSRKKLTQERLAAASELSTYYIALLERGDRQPTLKTLFKLAEALETTPEAMVKKLRQRMRGRPGKS